mgnify:CR=1 FL=1
MATKKRNKKYNPNKNDDFIHPLEHQTGVIVQYKNTIENALSSNSFTVNNLVNEGILCYRWIYIVNQMQPDIDTDPIRDWIENETAKLVNITTNAELQEIKHRKIKIHWKIRDMLLAFVDVAYKCICSIRSRLQYAKIFNEAMIRSYTKEAMADCRRRIHKQEIERQKKLGNKAFFSDTGDIVYFNEQQIEKIKKDKLHA